MTTLPGAQWQLPVYQQRCTDFTFLYRCADIDVYRMNMPTDQKPAYFLRWGDNKTACSYIASLADLQFDARKEPLLDVLIAAVKLKGGFE